MKILRKILMVRTFLKNMTKIKIKKKNKKWRSGAMENSSTSTIVTNIYDPTHWTNMITNLRDLLVEKVQLEQLISTLLRMSTLDISLHFMT